MTKKKSQSRLFLEDEGDEWFGRNKSKLLDGNTFEADYIFNTLMGFSNSINSILEIGCSNALKLEALCNNFNAYGFGIDPSEAAIKAGKVRVSSFAQPIKLEVGVASKLPYQNETMDLVVFGFCLYLVDREFLFQTLAEADRVLRPEGFIAITDFDPNHRHKRAYHHRAGLFSYKHDYPALLTASGHYHLVQKMSYSHNGPSFTKEQKDRIATSILFKEACAYPD
jgi:ubiquinone/menaquinone biosynthesis C-methylase UbiE